MIAWVSPRVIRCDRSGTEIVVPLNFRTKNHLGSVYFGALAVGADVAGGLFVMNRIRKESLPVSLVFSDFQAKFLKRPTADVHFKTMPGDDLGAFLDEVLRSDQRMTKAVALQAFCPTVDPHEIVGEFSIGLSLKKR